MINTMKTPQAYAEVYCFINSLGDKYKSKIPISVYNVIESNRDKNYNIEINANQEISQGMLSHEALALISALNLQYWCTSEEEKNELKQKYKENNEKEKEKYSYDNLFKNNNKTIDEATKVAIHETTINTNEEVTVYNKA